MEAHRDPAAAASSAETVDRIAANVGLVVHAPAETLRLCVLCLLAEGHLIIEDFPGVGKTMLAKALARSVDLGFSRLQFTPDLLPSDVTGVNVFNQRANAFEFRAGPVFANVLLVDEINRASPKTQSALLEAMQEIQVTIDGESYPLERPFMVLATQNPIEYEGTYPLPEAQLDRFTMRLALGYPPLADEARMLSEQTTEPPLETLRPVVSGQDVLDAIDEARAIFVEESLNRYVVALLRHTRTSSRLALGASPRSGIALLRVAKARALSEGRDYVLPDDVKAIAAPVLAHRLILAPEARSAGLTAEELVREAVDQTPVPVERVGERAGVTRRGKLTLALGLLAYGVAWLFGAKVLYPAATGLVLAPLGAQGMGAAGRRTDRAPPPRRPGRARRGRRRLGDDPGEPELASSPALARPAGAGLQARRAEDRPPPGRPLLPRYLRARARAAGPVRRRPGDGRDRGSVRACAKRGGAEGGWSARRLSAARRALRPLLRERRARSGRTAAPAPTPVRLRSALGSRVRRGRVAAQGALGVHGPARPADGEGARGFAARRDRRRPRRGGGGRRRREPRRRRPRGRLDPPFACRPRPSRRPRRERNAAFERAGRLAGGGLARRARGARRRRARSHGPGRRAAGARGRSRLARARAGRRHEPPDGGARPEARAASPGEPRRLARLDRLGELRGPSDRGRAGAPATPGRRDPGRGRPARRRPARRAREAPPQRRGRR